MLIWGKNGARNTPAFIDRSGHVILSGSGVAEGTYFSEGLMPFRGPGGWGLVDKGLHWVIPAEYSWVGEFSDGLGPVSSGRKFGYIDRSGKEIVQPKYDLAWAFSDGLGRVRIDIPTGTSAMTMEGLKPVYRELYSFVDRDGREAIPPCFEWVTDFHANYDLPSFRDRRCWRLSIDREVSSANLCSNNLGNFAKVWQPHASIANGAMLITKVHG